MVRKYTDLELLERVMEVEGFTHIPKGRWILGVRSKDDEPNMFDDKFYEYDGVKFIQVLIGTTNPGTTILQGGFKKYRNDGCAVVKSDKWYYDVWEYGLHNGKMPSLKQTGAKITVYRDGDLDNKSEELGKPTDGYYGINYHTNTYDFTDSNLQVTSEEINGWSAGCQVINERDKYVAQMDWYRKAQSDGSQRKVSFCLLKEF